MQLGRKAKGAMIAAVALMSMAASNPKVYAHITPKTKNLISGTIQTSEENKKDSENLGIVAKKVYETYLSLGGDLYDLFIREPNSILAKHDREFKMFLELKDDLVKMDAFDAKAERVYRAVLAGAEQYFGPNLSKWKNLPDGLIPDSQAIQRIPEGEHNIECGYFSVVVRIVHGSDPSVQVVSYSGKIPSKREWDKKVKKISPDLKSEAWKALFFVMR